MTGYVSPRAIVKGRVAPGAVILGPSRVGEKSLVDNATIIGYPVRHGLHRVISNLGSSMLEDMDSVSRGSTLGVGVIVRSGSIIYENSTLGPGVETGHNVLVREETVIGRGSLIGTGTIIDGRVTIGEHVRIESGVYIPPYTRIGSNVFIGPRAVFTNDRYPPSSRLQGAIVEDDVVIGANSVILPGVKIGRGSIIAAGSVVTRDVPPDSVVLGAPARVVGSRDDYEEKRRLWEKEED